MYIYITTRITSPHYRNTYSYYYIVCVKGEVVEVGIRVPPGRAAYTPA